MSRRYYSSGNEAVDAIGRLNIKGNVIPNNWYQHITRDNGKPYLLAISLLSDIVYWYRPEEVRDQSSGYTIGWKQKFWDNYLQKSYQEYAVFFGESKRSIKAALDRLEDLGIIRKFFVNYETEGKNIIPNVMYIEIFPEKIEEITFGDTEEEKAERIEKASLVRSGEMVSKASNGNANRISNANDEPSIEDEDDDDSSEYIELIGPTKKCTTPYKEMQDILQNNVGDPTKFCTTPYKESYHPLQNNVTPPTEFCKTNTYNTTEITNRNVYSVNQSVRPGTSLKDKIELIDGRSDRQTDEIEAYRRIIRKNIEYDAHMQEDDDEDREIYDELYQLICDIVCVKRDTVRIGGQEYPYEIVKSRFLKLDHFHLEYVKMRMRQTTTKIGNIKNYLLTSLYNAPATINHYYQQTVQHDQTEV